MIPMIKNILNNPWVEVVLRWILGAVFIVASFHKIIDPAGFAKIIYGYKLFPSEVINFFAILLPFIELTCGVALVLGIWSRSAAIIINGMLLAFIIAISINLIRGHEFDCGCFSFGGQQQSLSGPELLFRDLIWFIIGLFMIFYRQERKITITG